MILRPICSALPLLLVTVTFPLPARSQTPEEPKKVDAPSEPKTFETVHSLTFNGTPVSFRARAGETFVRDKEGKPIASFFHVAYVRTDPSASAPSSRPVSFIYNGGPGSASLWLHMGVFGPRRVVVPNEPSDDGAPPYPVVDNPATVLDVSDLVFIDPVGTGFSRALGGTDPKKFWGVMEDARSIADFIETWITENGRWNSPKYIIGESYGTARSAVLADELSSRDISVNGIVLISTVLDYQNSRFQDGAVMGYVSFLPTYAATAWYHRKLADRPADLEAFLDEVRDFSRNEYALALIAGNRLSEEERRRVLEKLARYTGLDPDYLDKANLRVPVFRFFKELLRDDKKVVGRLDGRYLGIEPDVVAETYESDPTSDSTGSAFTAAINSHLSGFLGVKMDRPYVTASRDAAVNWNWLVSDRAPNGGRFINLVPNLGRAMRRNKDLRVLVACGYYDFATPFFGAENALAEEGIVPERVRFTYYHAGHMMYLDSESRAALLKDVHAFIADGEP
jgi:carboxypeptidase C (cathepsin A)